MRFCFILLYDHNIGIDGIFCVRLLCLSFEVNSYSREKWIEYFPFICPSAWGNVFTFQCRGSPFWYFVLIPTFHILAMFSNFSSNF